MMSTGIAAYQNNPSILTQDSSLVQQNRPGQTGSSQNADPGSAASADGGDQVSLSPAVETARLRESLGLPPTGKVTRQDLVAQIQSDQEAVRQTLQNSLKDLGLAPNTSITISQDSKGQIQVTGAGSNNAALAKSLNGDTDFAPLFSRLSANSKLLNFPGQVQTEATATLDDFLDNSAAADSNLATLIQQYTSLKNASNTLEGLITLSSNTGAPFTFTNAPEQVQITGNAEAHD